MARDKRGEIGHTSFINSKKKNPEFKINRTILNEFVPYTIDAETNTAFFNKIDKNDNRIIFEYKTTKVTVDEFLDFMKKMEHTFQIKEGFIQVENALDKMASEVIQKVERENLHKTKPIYHYLANEYYDGLLIFESSNQKIWSVVGADSLALYEHYLNYCSEFSDYPTLEGKQWLINDAKLINKIDKEITKFPNSNIAEIIKKFDKTGSEHKYLEGSFRFAKEEKNPVAANLLPEENPFYNTEGIIYWQGKIQKGALIPYEDCKGDVMNSYQTRLEENWIKELRQKYNPVFNYKLLKKKKK